MVYIDNIESFIEAGQQLFINSPGQVRFLLPFFISFPTLTSHEQNPTHPAWCLLASNVWPGASSPRMSGLFSVLSCGAFFLFHRVGHSPSSFRRTLSRRHPQMRTVKLPEKKR